MKTIDYKLFDWSKTYWVNIKDVRYFLGIDKIYLGKDWGKDFGSIWNKDMHGRRYNDLNDIVVVKSLRQFLIEGIPLNQTQEYSGDRYREMITDLRNGDNKHGHISRYKTEEDFIKMLKSMWRRLYKSIEKYGLKSQKELIESNDTFVCESDGSDEIGAGINQDGKLIFFNGGHRLACAIILGIEKIPVKIAVRHRKWVDFMLGVYKFNKEFWGAKNKTYQTIDHVDFRDFVPEWSYEYRYNKIKENLGIHKGSLLDMGALWGDFCHKFESDGFDCIAVEGDKRMVHIMEKMKIAKEKKFKIIANNMFNLDNYSYDVILALNIFHHFLATKETHEKLRLMITKINCKEFYLQVHRHKANLHRNLYRNYEPKDFVKFIIRNNKCLNNYREIGEERGRRLFKIF